MSSPNQPVRGFTGTLTTASANPAPSTAAVVLPLPVNATECAIELSGTFVASVQFEASIDGGATWNSLSATPSSGGAAVTSASAAGMFEADVRPYQIIQVRCSAFTSGSVSVALHCGVNNS